MENNTGVPIIPYQTEVERGTSEISTLQLKMGNM